jgi:hypothetical protein
MCQKVFAFNMTVSPHRAHQTNVVVCFLLGISPASEFYMPTFRNTLSHLHSIHCTPTSLWRWNSVPKCQHIKFKRWGITKKKTYNIQNTVKVWNQTKVVALISLRTSGLCTIFSGLLKQHLGGCHAAISTVVMKCKGLFVNSCDCNSQISTVTEFLNSYVGETNVWVYSKIMLKNNDTLMQ